MPKKRDHDFLSSSTRRALLSCCCFLVCAGTALGLVQAFSRAAVVFKGVYAGCCVCKSRAYIRKTGCLNINCADYYMKKRVQSVTSRVHAGTVDIPSIVLFLNPKS